MAKKRPRRNVKRRVWLKGDMIGVHPKQVPRAQARLKALGAPGTYVPETGDLNFDSRRDYRDWAKATGRGNLDAGYGDQAPTGRGSAVADEIKDRIEWARRKGRLT